MSVVNCDELAEQLQAAATRLEELRREYKEKCRPLQVPPEVPLPETPECTALRLEIVALEKKVEDLGALIREHCDGIVCRLLLKQIAPLDRQLSVLFRELGHRDHPSTGPPRRKYVIMAQIKMFNALRTPIVLAIRAARCRYAPPRRPDSGVTLPDRR